MLWLNGGMIAAIPVLLWPTTSDQFTRCYVTGVSINLWPWIYGRDESVARVVVRVDVSDFG